MGPFFKIVILMVFVGVGIILRDDTSSFVAARSNYFNGLGSIREVKITSLVEALYSWGSLRCFLS